MTLNIILAIECKCFVIIFYNISVFPCQAKAHGLSFHIYKLQQ